MAYQTQLKIGGEMVEVTLAPTPDWDTFDDGTPVADILVDGESIFNKLTESEQETAQAAYLSFLDDDSRVPFGCI